MKLNKIFAIALAALTLTACSDDDNVVNTNDVTVNMQQSSMSVAEDAISGKYYSIPVVISGETNGPVTVTISVSGEGQEPATEDKDYIITSKTITIPAGETVGEFEFYGTGDNIINIDRQFKATIASAEGAKIGAEKSCLVTLIDEDKFLPEAYADVQGSWSCTLGSDTYNLTITGYEEGDPLYLKEVMTSGWNGRADVTAKATMSLDASTMEVTLAFPIGQTMATGIEFVGLGAADVRLCGFDGEYYYPKGGNVTLKSNPARTVMESQGMGLLGGVYIGEEFQGSWFRGTTVSLTKN